MVSHIPPKDMTHKERIRELASILAEGFMRMTYKQAESIGNGDYSVDLRAHPSIHAGDQKQ